MAARAKKVTSKATPKKASGKVGAKKGHRNRRVKTTKGTKRRVKSLKAPPTRRRRRGKKMTAKQRNAAKKARARLKKLETPADKKFNKGRAKHLRDLRAKRKGKKVGGKKAVVAGKGKGKKGHKLNMGAMMRRGRKAVGRGMAAAGAQIKRLMDAIAALKAKLMGKISAAMKARLEKQIAALETKLADVRKAKAAGKATTADVLAIKHQLTRKKYKAGRNVGRVGKRATRAGSGGPSTHGADSDI